MKKKMFLTSAIAMGFVAPAVAAPSHTDTFPDDGYMQEDYTYTNAATAANMDSVYEGSVNATAEYEDIFYNIVAGNYLAAGSDDEDGTICPAGSYCSGLTHAPYNATSAQGIETCPTGFGSSEAGSSSNTQCYRACDINNVGSSVSAIAHATAISGNDYYGSGTDTCVPTACENGWHVKAGTTAPNLTNIIGEVEGDGYTSNDSTGAEYYTDNMDNTIIANDPLAFAVDYGSKGKIHGHAQCSTVQGVFDFNWGTETLNQPITTHTTSELGSEGGRYCYCNVTGYTPEGGTLQSLSSSWVFISDIGDASNCAVGCALSCAYGMRRTGSYDLAFRAAMLGTVIGSPAMCEANTITINWSNADAEDISANNAGTATYGEDVRTPVKAETIKGKRFLGWKFSAPEQTNLSE